ncbi:MAG: hypothetical protein ACREEM_19325 [Blastocatellia bacterium]
MMKTPKQLIFALLISSVLAFNGLAQSANASSNYYWQDKKPTEKPKEKPKDDKPKDKPKDEKKKP